MTDNDGLSSTKTVTFTVSPSASLTCNGVACVLTLEDDAVVTVTLESRECTARNNTFRITQPAEEVLITDGCYSPDGGNHLGSEQRRARTSRARSSTPR